MASYPYRKARGVGSTGAVDPSFFLFAGDQQVITNRAVFAAGLVLPIHTPLAFSAANKLIAWVPGATDTTGKFVGITLEPVDTSATGTNQDTYGPYYTEGFFNHEALNWPAAIDTLPERQAAVAGTNFNVGRLP